MKKLTKIEPEPEHIECKIDLEWLSEDINNGLGERETVDIIRLLIHKVNELTSELNRIKGEQ